MTSATDADGPTGANRVSRRAEYAEVTRQAVINEARRLFDLKGYFATKVDDIAAAARVSPATVYVIGGKQGLLRILIDMWSAAPEIEVVRKHLEELDTAAGILPAVADLTRRLRRDHGDIMRVVLATAPNDAQAAEGLALATRRCREGMAVAARRLAELGALRDGMGADEALGILWFYFGYSGFSSLVDDNGWPDEKAEQWLLAAAGDALLRSPEERPRA